MTSVVKVAEVVQALADKIAAGADTASAGTSPNHELKAAMVAKGYFQAGQTAGGIPTPYQNEKFLSNNGTELEWRAPSLIIVDPTGDGVTSIIKDGTPVLGSLIPKPYVADQVLSNNGTQLEWHDLPEGQVIPPDDGDDGKTLVVENGKIKWRKLTGGDVALPETTGQSGKLLTTNGAPLSEGGGLFWNPPAGTPGSGTPGSLIGYAEALSSTEEYTFDAMVYPDYSSAISAEADGIALSPVIRWGNTNVVTLDDNETPAGSWVEDGVFEFGRDCYATVYISQKAVGQFDGTTGDTALAGLYVVHERSHDVDIVGGLIGRRFTSLLNISGSISCSLTAKAGDCVSLRGLVTVFGGTGGALRYGAFSGVRPNFGILIAEAFPGG